MITWMERKEYKELLNWLQMVAKTDVHVSSQQCVNKSFTLLLNAAAILRWCISVTYGDPLHAIYDPDHKLDFKSFQFQARY